MFFVISGYLITQLILLGLQDRTFSLWGFYQRRVRRIVPALLLILAACFVFGWFLLLPGEFSWFGRSMAWCAPFLANVFFATNTRYFEPWADYNPLLHLWSLGVEEQFYLVWPPLLVLAMRYGVTRPVLRAVIATSLVISIWGTRYAPASHFYLPGSRAWELAVGGLLGARQLGTARATIAGESCAVVRWLGRHGRSVAGLILIAAGAALLSGSNALPGAWSAVPVGGAALLIAAGPASPVNRQLLVRAPVVFVGRLSYSLYLWHLPVGGRISPGRGAFRSADRRRRLSPVSRSQQPAAAARLSGSGRACHDTSVSAQCRHRRVRSFLGTVSSRGVFGSMDLRRLQLRRRLPRPLAARLSRHAARSAASFLDETLLDAQTR